MSAACADDLSAPTAPPSLPSSSTESSLASLSLSESSASSADVCEPSAVTGPILLSSLLRLDEAAGTLRLEWTKGSVYDLIPDDSSARVRTLFESLRRPTDMPLGPQYFVTRWHRLEALVEAAPDLPSVLALDALARLVLHDPFGAVDSLERAQELAGMHGSVIDESVERSCKALAVEMIKLIAYNDAVWSGAARMSCLPAESPVFKYKPFRCPRSDKSLGTVTGGAFQALATDLASDWAALQEQAGDELAALRLQRYWNVQDGLVEGVFAISGESTSWLVQTLKLSTKGVQVTRSSAIQSRRAIVDVVAAHSTAFEDVRDAIDREDGLSCELLNETHDALLAHTPFDYGPEPVTLLDRGRFRRGITFATMPALEGQTAPAVKLYADARIIETEVDRMIGEVEVELEHLRDAGRALYLSVYIHYCLASIHPWSDGNGRMARIIGSVPLIKLGLPPLIVTTKHRLRYLQVLQELTVSGNETDLLPLARVLVESTRSAFAFLRALPRSLDDTNAPEPSIKIGARPRVSEPLRSVRI